MQGTQDSIVTAVIEKFKERAATGQRKYGTTLDRTDLKVHEKSSWTVFYILKN